uniref:Uncharacterized protein n=1 Tax=Micrurus carvalhoi TaxID=3147026 RepID=A0A2H6NJ82_9SAUR
MRWGGGYTSCSSLCNFYWQHILGQDCGPGIFSLSPRYEKVAKTDLCWWNLKQEGQKPFPVAKKQEWKAGGKNPPALPAVNLQISTRDSKLVARGSFFGR